MHRAGHKLLHVEQNRYNSSPDSTYNPMSETDNNQITK